MVGKNLFLGESTLIVKTFECVLPLNSLILSHFAIAQFKGQQRF